MTTGNDYSASMSVPEAVRYFDFFGLPRELRDEVYNSLETGIHTFGMREENAVMQVFVKDRLNTAFLLISKQFAQEYKERQEGRSRLIIKDTMRSGIPDTVILPEHPKSLKKLELRLVSVGNHYEQIRAQCNLLERIATSHEDFAIEADVYATTTNSLNHFTLQDVLHSERRYDGPKQVHQGLQVLAALPNVSRVRLFSGAWLLPRGLTIEDLESGMKTNVVLLGTWDKEKGEWQKPETDS